MLKKYNNRLFDAFLTIPRDFFTSKNTKSANLSLQLLLAQVSTFGLFWMPSGYYQGDFYMPLRLPFLLFDVSDERLGRTESEVQIEADWDVSRVIGDVELHYLLVLLVLLLLI